MNESKGSPPKRKKKRLSGEIAGERKVIKPLPGGKARSFARVGDVLAKVLLETEKSAAHPRSSMEIVARWPDLVPKKLGKVSRAVTLRDGRLVVEVTEPVWKQEMLMQKKRLINSINRKIGKPAVGEIVFKVRKF